MEHERVGCIGLGNMGLPIARRLLEAGYSVAVHNRSQEPVRQLVELGATGMPDAASVAAASDIVLTALPTPDTVRDIFLGENGIVAAATTDALLIDLSTVNPELSREIAAAAQRRGVGFLDAPISGGPEGAKAGTLTIMAGGDAQLVERARPVFEAFGQRVYHVGPSGAGATVKLVNQLLVSINATATAEAFSLAVRAGADPAMTLEVIRNSWGASRVFERNMPMMIEENYDGGANVSIVLKDITVILELARSLGLTLKAGEAAFETLSAGRNAGFGTRDVTALRLIVNQESLSQE